MAGLADSHQLRCRGIPRRGRKLTSYGLDATVLDIATEWVWQDIRFGSGMRPLLRDERKLESFLVHGLAACLV